MKKESRVMAYWVAIFAIVIYCVSLVALVLNKTQSVREKLYDEIDAEFLDRSEQFQSTIEHIPENSTREEIQGEYLRMLQSFTAKEDYSYSVTRSCFLSVGNEEKPMKFLGGHNMLLAEIFDESGDSILLPMAFQMEDTADVAALFQQVDGINVDKLGYKDMTGYWADGLFYLQEFVVRNKAAGFETVYYKSPIETPEDKEEITYTVFGSYSGRSRLLLRILSKSDISTTGMSNYTAAWEKTDKLTEKAQLLLENGVKDGLTIIEDGLNSVMELGVISYQVDTYIEDYDSVRYIYAVSFSPLKLALKRLWNNGTIFLLTAIYVGATVLLLYGYNKLRKSKICEYEDEIVRQKQALDYAKNAEQSRREMTSAIAHELKTPIAVLSSYAEALQENIDAEKQNYYLSIIQEEADRMDHLVLELLDLSRLEAGKYKLKREEFDLEELARTVIKPLEPELMKKELKLNWQIGNPMVYADSYRIGQVVENFMTNAIRHTPQGGKITIRIGTQSETFSVENQGKAIPAEHLKKVWETFWQGDRSRNERGSGLGLAICRNIVLLHGGSCKVENTTIGVRFSISLEKTKKLYQLGNAAQEEIIDLDFPISQSYTTVDRVMTRLNLAKGKMLYHELQKGNLFVGDEVVRDKKKKLYPNYVLRWEKYRITIKLDDENKRKMLLMEHIRHGGLGCADPVESGKWLPGA